MLVGGVAAAVVAVGLYTLVRGVTGGFMKDIDLPAAPDRWEPLIEGIGRVGYVAKGIAFALVGVLLWQAATSADVSTATGLDGALAAIAEVGGGAVAAHRGRGRVRRVRALRAGPRPLPRPRPVVLTCSGLRAAGDVDDLAGDEPGALADEERHGVRDVLGLAGAGDRDRRGARWPRRAPTPGRSARPSPSSCR